MRNNSKLHLLSGVAIIAASVSACGGQSNAPPPETPPPASQSTTEPSMTEPSTTEGSDPASEGEHTMPDGTTMPGHHHGDGDSPDQPDAE